MSGKAMEGGLYVIEGRALPVPDSSKFPCHASCWNFCYKELVFPRDFSYLVQELQRTGLAMEMLCKELHA